MRSAVVRCMSTIQALLANPPCRPSATSAARDPDASANVPPRFHLDHFPRTTIGNLPDLILTFIRSHAAWAPFVVFLLAAGESLAFISLLLPATVILLGLGGVVGAAGLAFWPIWAAAAVGAILGDWFSYWLGYHYKHAITKIWPLSRHPEFLPRATAVFAKWGIAGVFFGRFFGPLRSAMPLVAGICAMPQLPFQLANVASAIIWATGVLAPGVFAMQWLL